MKKKTVEKYVTLDVFQNAMEEVNASFKRMEVSHKNVALEILQVDKRLDLLEKTVSTKSDIQTILNTIDNYSKRLVVHDNKAIVQDYRLNEIEPKLDDHEKRITILENPS